MRLSSLVASVAIAPMLVAASGPVRLQPSTPWVLDYAEDSCRLLRQFGEGGSKTVLLLESAAPDEMEMLVFGKPIYNYSEEVGARFLPIGGKTFKGRNAVTTDKGYPALLWPRVILLPDELIQKREKEKAERDLKPGVRPPPTSLAEQAVDRAARKEFATRATELEIQTRRNQPVILETGSMGEALAMFEKCGRDSLTDWGIDPNLEDKIVRPAWAIQPMKWFSSDDYPKDMLMRGEQSQVRVRLLVDASGKVTKCTSLSHFKFPEFNQITCSNIMRRARFEPAELADGTKVPSYYTNQIVFRIGY